MHAVDLDLMTLTTCAPSTRPNAHFPTHFAAGSAQTRLETMKRGVAEHLSAFLRSSASRNLFSLIRYNSNCWLVPEMCKRSPIKLLQACSVSLEPQNGISSALFVSSSDHPPTAIEASAATPFSEQFWSKHH